MRQSSEWFDPQANWGNRALNLLLWILQILLAIYFLSVGVTHLIVPPAAAP